MWGSATSYSPQLAAAVSRRRANRRREGRGGGRRDASSIQACEAAAEGGRWRRQDGGSDGLAADFARLLAEVKGMRRRVRAGAAGARPALHSTESANGTTAALAAAVGLSHVGAGAEAREVLEHILTARRYSRTSLGLRAARRRSGLRSPTSRSPVGLEHEQACLNSGKREVNRK